eukprot:8031927-Pyramimonas_sp.AAC.1
MGAMPSRMQRDHRWLRLPVIVFCATSSRMLAHVFNSWRGIVRGLFCVVHVKEYKITGDILGGVRIPRAEGRRVAGVLGFGSQWITMRRQPCRE